MNTSVDVDSSPGYYLVLTADATEDEARLAFIRRFHQEPERVYRMYPTQTVWVGPVPKDNDDRQVNAI